jgi:hypothetical protein
MILQEGRRLIIMKEMPASRHLEDQNIHFISSATQLHVSSPGTWIECMSLVLLRRSLRYYNYYYYVSGRVEANHCISIGFVAPNAQLLSSVL